MASYLAAKRFFSSSLLSKSLLPPAASASRSVHTNAMHNYDDDQNVEFESRSERSFPRTARRDCTFSDVLVLNPFFPAWSLSQSLNMMDQFKHNPFLSAPRGIGAGAGVRPVAGDRSGAGDRPGFRGRLESRETEDALLLRVNMAGFGKENVKIFVGKNSLTIKGEDAKEGEEEDEEESAPCYVKIGLLSMFYKVDHIKAEMKNGVLKIILPKIKEEEMTDVINVIVE